MTTYNTAGAGKFVVEQGDRGAAAVLSRRAAAGFGLTVLAESIQDVPDNRTKFLVLGTDAAPADGPGGDGIAPFRTTLAFGVRNEPGTLLQALRVFADRSINLSKLESRPSRGAAWEYVFWADLDADRTDPNCAAAIEQLAAVATMVRVFGSYQRAPEASLNSGGRSASLSPNRTAPKCQILALTAPIRSAIVTIRDVRDRGLTRRLLEGALEQGDDGLDPTIAKGFIGDWE